PRAGAAPGARGFRDRPPLSGIAGRGRFDYLRVMTAPKKPKAKRRGARCPICRAPAVADHAPFCSRRCADRDLARWLGGEYRVPTDEAPSPEDLEEAFRTTPVGR